MYVWIQLHEKLLQCGKDKISFSGEKCFVKSIYTDFFGGKVYLCGTFVQNNNESKVVNFTEFLRQNAHGDWWE